ncbi:MAG: hypothetical protein IKW83_03350 [Muribaculaceae bacterium]|nr:hypothetical protein [Muribaculaceae bacterium]
MKKITLLLSFMLAISITSCDNKTENTNASQPASSATVTSGASDDVDSTTPPSQETVDQLNKAVTEEHANPDANYTYDATTNTVTMVKEIEFAAGQSEEDFDELTEYNKFVEEFKKSTKSSDATIKSKGATITVKYVNKATGDEFMGFDITPEDLK